MKYSVLADGSRVAYSATNPIQSTPLLLLPGFCEDSSVWADWLQYFDNEYIVCIDMPGFGQSDTPAVINMEVYIAAITAVLDDLEAPQVILIGHSLGGYAALAFADKYPERLAGLGLFHSHPFADPEDRKEIRRRGIETLQAGKKDLYVTQLFPGLFTSEFGKSHPEIIQKLVENAKNHPVEGIIAALQIMIDRPDTQDVLREIQVPVQFLLGADDTLVPIDLGMKASVLPVTADVEILDGVAHMAMFEAPQRAADSVKAFYKWITAQAMTF